MIASATRIMPKTRCAWAGSRPLDIAYHDSEWGVPVHDDQRLFEFLLLEGAQAGLSWATILAKRDRYRAVFDDFRAERVAGYDTGKIESLLGDAGIVRNRLKVQSAVTNAQAFLAVQSEFGSFDAFAWSFVDRCPRQNAPRHARDVAATSVESSAFSQALKKRGFKFVGSTICYAFMQAVGMVNDHVVDCFRQRAVQRLGRMTH